MSDDERAFLNAIYANLDDDAPRLVYADWLQEQGRDQEAEQERKNVRQRAAGRRAVWATDAAITRLSDGARGIAAALDGATAAMFRVVEVFGWFGPPAGPGPARTTPRRHSRLPAWLANQKRLPRR